MRESPARSASTLDPLLASLLSILQRNEVVDILFTGVRNGCLHACQRNRNGKLRYSWVVELTAGDGT